jgi:hypothetical protein
MKIAKGILNILIIRKKLFIDMISLRIDDKSDLMDNMINNEKLIQAKVDLEFYEKMLNHDLEFYAKVMEELED